MNIPNPIKVNIVAQSGAGNLLGNLLCGVTNLFNDGGALSRVASGLNQVARRVGVIELHIRLGLEQGNSIAEAHGWRERRRSHFPVIRPWF